MLRNVGLGFLEKRWSEPKTWVLRGGGLLENRRFWSTEMGRVRNGCSLPKVSILVTITIQLDFGVLSKQKRGENRSVIFSLLAESLLIIFH